MFTPFVNGIDRFDVVKHPHFQCDKTGRELWLSQTPYSTLNDNEMVYVTAYGKGIIDRGRFEWGILMKESGSSDSLTMIGIASGSALVTINEMFCNLQGGYGYQTNGLIRKYGKITSNRKYGRNHCSLNKNDVLFIRLDLIEKRLMFLKNGVLLDNIDISNDLDKKTRTEFKLAISMYDDKQKFEIVNSTQYLAKFALYQYNISKLPNEDSFAFAGTESQLIFSHDKKSCIHNKRDNNSNNNAVDTAYGKHWIPINHKTIKEYEWIIHIQGESPQNIEIGIFGQYYRNIKSFSSEFDKTRYGYGLTFDGKKTHYTIKNRDKRYSVGGGFSCLDFVHIKLNFLNKTLKFMRNGYDMGIAFNINNGLHMPNFDEMNDSQDNLFGYRLAIKIRKSNCKVSIKASHALQNVVHIVSLDNLSMLNSKAKTPKKILTPNSIGNNNNNNKNGNIFKYDNFNIGNDDEKHVINNNWSTNNIFDKLDKLHIDLKNASKKIADMVNILSIAERDNTAKFNHEILGLKELFRAKQFIPQMVDTNYQFTMNLMGWSAKVTPFIENHFKKWKYWTSDQFTDWIIGFDNGRFNKYNDNNQLRKIMNRDDNCETLKEMAKNVHVTKLISVVLRDTFKITDPNDRKILITALNKLTTGQFVNNNKNSSPSPRSNTPNKSPTKNITRTFTKPKTKQNRQAQPNYYMNNYNENNNSYNSNYNEYNNIQSKSRASQKDFTYINKYIKPNPNIAQQNNNGYVHTNYKPMNINLNNNDYIERERRPSIENLFY